MTWDLTKPADGDLASLGAGVIRTMKTDLQTALTTEGIFPGPVAATPVFRWTPRVGNTASRPANSAANPGSIYYNTDLAQLQLDNGTSWIPLCDASPSGMIGTFATAAAPSSAWLACNGSAVSRTTYAALFAAIGTTHGSGDGLTTFNLPDYRGQFLRMVDGGAGRDPDTAARTAMNPGGNTGDAVGTVQTGQVQSHPHGVTDPGHSHSDYSTGPANQLTNGGAGQNTMGRTTLGTLNVQPNTTGLTVNASGGNETRPTNAYVNYFIHI